MFYFISRSLPLYNYYQNVHLYYLMVVSKADEFLGEDLSFCLSFARCESAVCQQNITVKTFDLNLLFFFPKKSQFIR